jgi:hypothetical protein
VDSKYFFTVVCFNYQNINILVLDIDAESNITVFIIFSIHKYKREVTLVEIVARTIQ